jgi:phosphoribosylformimino-5-aminoimidazole carboxamide ribonucleotide (ProFAR) isomerase
VIVGIDAKDGMVAVHGWSEGSEHTAQELALRFEDQGVAAIVYTDGRIDHGSGNRLGWCYRHGLHLATQ